MAIITSYSTLQTAISDYLARSDLTTWLPNFTQNWEERFMREPDNWGSWMERALSVSISSGVAAVPSDYLGLKVAYISGQNSAPLKRISLDQLYQRFPRANTSGGTPAYIARNATNFEFGPNNASGTLVGTYWAKPTVMRSYTTGGADAVAHFLIVNAPDLCLYGSLLEAAPFIKQDARLQVWGNLYKVALDGYRFRMQAEDFSGSPPHTVVV
jgi:hypothetical protein